jgi:FixJ family two-component response regulator
MTGSFDGLTLLRWMRTAGRNTPVILLTGSEDGGLDRRAESAGATRVLRKSDSPGKILEAARHALEPTESRVANEVVEEVHQPVTPAAVSVKNLGWLASAMARVRSALNLFC